MLKICSKCKQVKNITEFWISNGRYKDKLYPYCKECASLYGKKYYKENEEHLKKYSKEWNENNPNYIKEWNKKYYSKEYHNEYNKKYYEENKEHLKENHKIWKKENLNYNKEWRKENPEKCKEYKRKRRARKFKAEGSFTEKEFQKKLQFYNYKCCVCGTDLRKTTIHRDHIQPLSKGGSDNIDNIQPLCEHCNLSKGIKYIDYN